MSRRKSTPQPPNRSRSSRYAALGGIAFLLVAISLGLAGRLWKSPAWASGPIILISIDTLRADHLPTYGYRAVRTPTIDAFAADGIVFENAYAHSPQTLPSHVSILSGRLPFEHGVRDNIGFAVKPGETLLPTMLREAGFASGGLVSAYVLRDETAIANGFDPFDAMLPPSSPEIPVRPFQPDA